MIEKKLKDWKSLSEIMEIDPRTQKCTDKIEIISLVHKGGHITLYTKKGNAFHIRLSELIKNLIIDKDPEIFEEGYTLFENNVMIRFPKNRFGEYEKIFKRTGISYVTMESKGNIVEAYMEINSLAKKLYIES